MDDDGWRTADDRWPMANDRWPMADHGNTIGIRHPPSAIRHPPSGIGHRPSAIVSRRPVLVVRAERPDPLDLTGDHEPGHEQGGQEDVRILLGLKCFIIHARTGPERAVAGA